jgi:c(7)-type cytochrome triheme protein
MILVLPAIVLSAFWTIQAQTTSVDYSRFKHDNPQHARLPCLLCHRRENNAARPTLPGKSEHAPCAGCHAAQFNSSSGPMCSICHSNGPAVKPFPALRSFNVKFDHASHAGVTCARCHKAKRGGVALSIPSGLNAHTLCYGCHTPQAKANDRRLGSCSTCHSPGRFSRTTERAAAFRVGFSHAKHDRSEDLRCADCHRVRGKRVTSPVALNHHAPKRASSCRTCHDGKRAFGGDDFSVCTRCHTGPRWHF